MGLEEKKDFKHCLILALIPVATFIVRLIGMTLRIKLLDPHQVSPYANPKERFIYAFWHNQQILSAFTFRNFGVRVLVSRSKDGDYISKTLESFGFGTVRSSSSSGKINALRGLARELKAGFHTAITPDGPRGPLYQAQPGAVFLAALTGHRLTPFGCAAEKVWKLRRTWDQFEIPKPFSRVVIIFGEPLTVPRELDDPLAGTVTKALENSMTALRQQARQALGLPVEEPRASRNEPKDQHGVE